MEVFDLKPLTDIYVACFSDVHRWGGALSFARGLANGLRHRGLSTTLLGVTRHQEEPASPEPSADRLNVRVPPSPLLWRIQSWRVTVQLRERLRQIPPPRHTFVALSPYWVVAAKRAWPTVPVLFKVPCLLTNCLPFTWGNGRPPSLWQRVNYEGIRRIERRALSLADIVVTPTEEARAELLTFQPAAGRRVVVCPYGVEPRTAPPEVRAAKRRDLGLADDAFAFLLAGVCDRNKAFDWAVREMASVDGRGHLLIVGKGPEWDALAPLCERPGVTDRVHLVGPQDDMTAWYAAADCVLSTSHYDMFPNTIQEGMAYGRPVVVPEHTPPTVYAGIADLVDEHGAGLLYDRRQPGALSQAMNRLIHDRTLSRELGARGHQVAEARAGWEPFADLIGGSAEPRVSIPDSTAINPATEAEVLHVH